MLDVTMETPIEAILNSLTKRDPKFFSLKNIQHHVSYGTSREEIALYFTTNLDRVSSGVV